MKNYIPIVAVAALVSATVFESSSSVTAQELLGYWQLEETNVDSDAVDSSGNGFDGVFEGDVDPSVDGAPGFGSGAYFDGETAQVLIGPGDENGFGDLVNDFTVMAWINPESFDTKGRVFGGFPVGGGWGWGTVGDSLEITTYGVKDYDQPVPLELDEWVHAAIVLNADNEAIFYVNGEFVGEQFHGAPGNPTANDYYIGWSCCDTPQEHFQGSLDEVALFEGSLTEEQILNAMTLGVSKFNGGGGVIGDFDGSGERDLADIDALTQAIMAGDMDSKFDVNEDGAVGADDRQFWVENLTNTYFGDSNFDGEFSSSDFVSVFGAAKYETGQAATWGEGDWNGDGEFTSSDFVAAFTGGGYEKGPREGGLMVVPEPSSIALILMGILALAASQRTR